MPSGFTVLNSGTNVTVPAGQIGVLGVYLQPSGQLPPPGMQVSFTVTATSVSNPAITQSQVVMFTMPAIDAVTITASPVAVNTTPGVGGSDTLTITNVGNVPENNVALAAVLPSGLAINGLPPTVSLGLNGSMTVPITLTPDPSTPLNSELDATITATFGPSGSTQTQTVQIPVNVVVPGAVPIADAVVVANHLGDSDLANRFNDLSVALTNLVQTPTNPIFKSQALAALDALIGLISADPFLAPVVPPLKADRTELAQAVTASDIQTAETNLGNDLASLATTLADEAAFGFIATLLPNSQVIQPQAPASFEIKLQNTGSAAATYDLNISGVPGGVNTSFDHTSITLQPGQITGQGGVQAVHVTLTSTSTTELDPFAFTVTATAEPASEISRSLAGSLTARNQLVEVTAVTPNPPFTNPGGQVDVQATLLNAVNKQQQGKVFFTVTDSANTVLFTSTPVPTTLNVLTTLTTVDLGNFKTTGFALGSDTITVTVEDSTGTPIPGATGTGTLLIGTPVSATLTTTPSALPSGSGTSTTTLQLNAQTPFNQPFSIAGQAAIGSSSAVAVSGNYAYVGTATGIDVVDVSNPSAPQVLSTFGGSDLAGVPVSAMQVSNGDLIVLASPVFTNTAATASLLIYSLATPAAPTLLGKNPLTFQGNNYHYVGGLNIAGGHAFTSQFLYRYHIFGNDIFEQYGQSLDIDISDPIHPFVASVIYNDPPDPSLSFDPTDGTSNVWQTAAANATTELIGTTNATGSFYTGPNVQGLVMVVDNSNPASPNVLEKLAIPGMAVVTGISVQGNQAFVIGSSQYWQGGTVGLGGNVVVATLDLTNPQQPTIVSTQTLSTVTSSRGMSFVYYLGNNEYVTDSIAGPNAGPEMLLFNASDPANVGVTQVTVPATIGDFAAANNLLYTVDGSNLLIYNIGQPSETTVTAQVTVPTSNGVSIVPNSFNLAPTKITTGPNSETLEWHLAFNSGYTGQTITWQSSISNLKPGEARTVADTDHVAFVSQGSPGAIGLPDQVVAGVQIIGINPVTQTVAPGGSASYEVELFNPTNSSLTYNLSVQGVVASWVGLVSSVTVGPGATSFVPLTLTTDSFAAEQDYGFSVTATAGGATGSVQADLVLAGQPIAPDFNAHGIVVSLAPVAASAGIGDAATYVVQLTNTGSTTDTFSLAVNGLPAAIASALGQTMITVPPGATNFRDVALTLTAQPGASVGNDPFSISATSTANAAITSSSAGSLTVLQNGVSVGISPSSGPPGTTFPVTVTNTGTVKDTFKLTLAGPAALVSTLATTSVTLNAGASQVVNVTTGAVSFADSGSLSLTVIATSQTNSAAQAGATANLIIPTTQGLTAQLTPSTQNLQQPGAASFLALANNIGNAEDAYTATIVGTAGPIKANLLGLDGLPTQTIPIFRLPGLSTGALELQTTISAFGQGTVTIRITSLNDRSRTTTVTAQVSVGAAALLLLDPSGSNSLVNTGNGSIQVVNGNLVIDSKNAKAGIDSGNGNVSANEIDVTGKLSQTGKGKFLGKIVTGKAPLADPLAGLAAPAPSGLTFKAVNISGKTTRVLSPGTYVGGIHVSNGATVTLLPGIYYLQGGGLSATGNAKLTGSGVMIYNAPKSSQDAISISGNATATLAAPTSGPYQGVAIFQSRNSSLPINVASATLSLTGTLYALAARLNISGNIGQHVNVNAGAGNIPTAVIVADLTVSGNGVLTVDPIGHAATKAAAASAAALPSASGTTAASSGAAGANLQTTLNLLASDLVSRGRSLSSPIGSPTNSIVANAHGSWSDPSSTDPFRDLFFARFGPL